MPPSTGTTAMGLVVGGGVSASTNYRLVSSTVYGAAAGASPASSNYVLRGGVVGRTAAP